MKKPGDVRDLMGNLARKLSKSATPRSAAKPKARKASPPKAKPSNVLTLVPAPARPSVKISDATMLRAAQRPPRLRKGTHGTRINPFKLPEFPKQATPPKNLTMAMDEMPGFDWAGQTLYNGYGAFWEGQAFLGYPYLAELAQRPEYRRISERIATEMTRKWIKLQAVGDDKVTTEPDEKTDPSTGGAADRDVGAAVLAMRKDEGKKAEDPRAKKIKIIQDELDRMHVKDAFKEIAEQDGFFGRGHLYLDTGDTTNLEELKTTIGDGREAASRLKVNKAKPLLRIKTVEAQWCYPLNYNSSDPLDPNWYKPEIWFVMSKQIHRSRLLTFVGREVPDMLKPAYAFGGLSLSQMAKPYVDNFLNTRESVADLISAFSTMVLKTNMASAATDGGALYTRVDLFNMMRDNRGTMVVDKETEDFSNVNTPLGTLDSLQAQSQEQMSSVAGIPLVILLGIQPMGLNASSEGEIRVFYDLIEAMQEVFFRPNLTKVIDFIQLSKFGEIDQDITFKFEPLWSLDAKQKAEVKKIEAETDTVLIDGGVLHPEESRKRIAADPDTPYDALDVDDVPEEPEPDMGMGGAGGGFGEEPDDGGSPAGGDREAGGQGANIRPFADRRQAADAATFEESKHQRNEDGEFTAGGGAAQALLKAAPALKHFQHSAPKPARYVKGRMRPEQIHHWIMASTEVGQLGNPITIPAHETATGIAIKINPKTKHIHFAELNSHIKGAGRAMVEAIIAKYPDYKFSVTDWSHEEGNAQSFWQKIESKHADKFAHDAAFNEADHPRGQPGNKGQFGPGGGAGKNSKNKPAKPASMKPTDKTESDDQRPVSIPMSNRPNAELKTQFIEAISSKEGNERTIDAPIESLRATQETVSTAGPAAGKEGDAPIVGIRDAEGNIHVINGHHRVEKAKAAGKKTIKARIVDDASSEPAAEHQTFASKKEHAAHLLQQGVTTKEMLAALGWPSISMPAMAKSLGMNLEKSKQNGITTYKGTPMSPAERAAAGLKPPGSRRRARKNLSLLEHLAASGGISSKDPLVGDIRSIIGTKNKFIPGFGMLIRPTGRTLDNLREASVEAKYLNDPDGISTVSTLLDAIEGENRGARLYPQGIDLPDVDNRDSHYHAIDVAINEELTKYEIDPKTVPEKTMKRVVEILDREGETDPLMAYERAVMEETQDESAEHRIDDYIPDWDVPDDDGAASETGGRAS